VTEWSEKCDREIERSSKLRRDINAFRAELNEARAAAQKADDEA
jgi:hypothetical protein